MTQLTTYHRYERCYAGLKQGRKRWEMESRQAIQHFSQRNMRSICPMVVKVVNYYLW